MVKWRFRGVIPARGRELLKKCYRCLIIDRKPKARRYKLVLPKITNLFQVYTWHKTKAGRVRTGPWWRGTWVEDGKRRSVYIGKELPPELMPLFHRKYSPPLNVQFRRRNRKGKAER